MPDHQQKHLQTDAQGRISLRRLCGLSQLAPIYLASVDPDGVITLKPAKVTLALRSPNRRQPKPE